MPMIVYLWVPLGFVGMLLATWAYAKEDSGPRSFTVGHIVLGLVLGPLAFAGGVIWALLAADYMKHIDRWLSIELFTWRKGNRDGEL